MARSGEPALLLMLDIDHFKAVNDQHGHAAGDLVIRAVAQSIAQTVRPMDTVARIGGEEFAIILPNCPTSFGVVVAERIRQRVETHPFDVGGERVRVTVSVGVATFPSEGVDGPNALVREADRALYAAKEAGRNRVV